jgi:hypothetical protein
MKPGLSYRFKRFLFIYIFCCLTLAFVFWLIRHRIEQTKAEKIEHVEKPIAASQGPCDPGETLFSIEGEPLCGIWKTDSVVAVHSPHEPATNTSPEFKIVDARPPIQVALAEEIAREEGWYAKVKCIEDEYRVNRSTVFYKDGTYPNQTCMNLPQVLHNPGSLAYAKQDGAVVFCTSLLTGADECGGYASFSTDEAGWAALHKDIEAKWAHWKKFRIELNDLDIAEMISFSWSSGGYRGKYADDVLTRLHKRGF